MGEWNWYNKRASGYVTIQKHFTLQVLKTWPYVQIAKFLPDLWRGSPKSGSLMIKLIGLMSFAYNCSHKYPHPNSNYLHNSFSMICGASSVPSHGHIGEPSPQALFSFQGWIINREIPIPSRETWALTSKIVSGLPVMDLAITVGHGVCTEACDIKVSSVAPGVRNHWFSQCTPHPGLMHFTVCC